MDRHIEFGCAKKAPNPVGGLAGTTWLKEDGWGYKN